jgi:hypothetical protein
MKRSTGNAITVLPELKLDRFHCAPFDHEKSNSPIIRDMGILTKILTTIFKKLIYSYIIVAYVILIYSIRLSDAYRFTTIRSF